MSTKIQFDKVFTVNFVDVKTERNSFNDFLFFFQFFSKHKNRRNDERSFESDQRKQWTTRDEVNLSERFDRKKDIFSFRFVALRNALNVLKDDLLSKIEELNK